MSQLPIAVQAEPNANGDPFAGILTQDASMAQLFSMVRAVAASPVTVLLEGESGTGKRLIAQAIHRADPRRRGGPFVEVSCGALPETLLESELFGHVKGAFTGAIGDRPGRFELAEGGTILLDEIDAFSPLLQVKLLRVIHDRCYERVGDPRTRQADVRVIAAANRPLAELVSQGRFRQDLFYRLNVITLRLPPLRERPDDLPLLVSHFIARNARAMGKTITGISREAMALMARYPWPGNVRELEHVLERAVVLARRSVLGVGDLPSEVRASRAEASASDRGRRLKAAMQQPEREIIVKTLESVRWNRSEAARRLGVHRSTLYLKMRRLGIDAKAER